MTASHNELDLESLEQLTRGTHTLGKTIVADCPNVNGCVVLSTCNRFEVYLDVDLPSDVRAKDQCPASSTEPTAHWPSHHAQEQVLQLIARESGLETQPSAQSFTFRVGDEAATHLFQVAAGLDSLVVGEREIAGQVRKSLGQAHQDGLTSPVLERLFQKALNASKRVANHTQLGANGRSVVSVALELAQDSVPQWTSASALVVGTGAYAGATVAALRTRGVRHISVYSGSGRAEEFARSHGVMPSFDLVEAVGEADIVVCCSGMGAAGTENRTETQPSPRLSTAGYVLNAAAVVAGREARTRKAEHAADEPRKLVVIDLALHRDADPRIADLSSVYLIDLETVRANAPQADVGAIADASGVVRAAIDEFTAVEKDRTHDIAIKRLVAQYEERKAVVVAELMSAGELPEDAQRAVSKVLQPQMHRDIMAVRGHVTKS